MANPVSFQKMVDFEQDPATTHLPADSVPLPGKRNHQRDGSPVMTEER
jgi:hypothetical protein